MVRFTFKKIPKLAGYFYFVGFLLLVIAVFLFFYFPGFLMTARLQQLFILGAIVASIGSVINCFYQFKK